MINFSQNQVDAFGDDLLRSFISELCDRARFRHPEQAAGYPGDQLEQAMTKEVEGVRTLGLRTKGELKRFSDLSMTFGFGFAEREDWARETFALPGLTPAERLKEVENSSVFVIRAR